MGAPFQLTDDELSCAIPVGGDALSAHLEQTAFHCGRWSTHRARSCRSVDALALSREQAGAHHPARRGGGLAQLIEPTRHGHDIAGKALLACGRLMRGAGCDGDGLEGCATYLRTGGYECGVLGDGFVEHAPRSHGGGR